MLAPGRTIKNQGDHLDALLPPMNISPVPVHLVTSMDFELTDEQRLIRRQIRTLCEDFDDEYWREKDETHEFAWEFFDAFADGGWCGVTIPTEYGGHGYGVQEASIIQQEVARSGAAMAGTSITSHHVFSAAPRVRRRGSQETVPPGHCCRGRHGLYGRHGAQRRH